MKIPRTGRKKALIIIDVQPAFMQPHNLYIVDSIVSLIQKEPYDLYVESVFDVSRDSLWYQQQRWSMPEHSDVSTDPKIRQAMPAGKTITIQKDTRSVFKGYPDLNKELKKHGIEELHLAGIATHDCVLASAFEAFDLGYPVYVLEECCQSHTPGRHDKGVELLRYQNMTNTSCLADAIDV